MRRGQNNDRWGTSTPPVEHFELSDSRVKLRLAAVIVLGLIAVACVGSIIWQAIRVEPGRVIIESTAKESCAGDFVLQYDIGEGESALQRALSRAYTDATADAYKIFSSHKSFEGFTNLHTLNLNPNKPIEIQPELYEALALLENSGDRTIFLAPIAAEYESLCFSSFDHEASELDPDKNPEQAAYFDEILSYITNSAHISLELSDGLATLHVSDEYLAFATKYEIDELVSLNRIVNAFICDYIADRLAEEGYRNGILTSFDGYVRSLGDARADFRIYDRDGIYVTPAAIVTLEAGQNLVSLRDFPLSELDRRHYYEYASGEIVTPYLDSSGRDKAAYPALTVYGAKSCAELALEAAKVYISDTFLPENLVSNYIYCKSASIIHTGNAEFSDVFPEYEIQRQS